VSVSAGFNPNTLAFDSCAGGCPVRSAHDLGRCGRPGRWPASWTWAAGSIDEGGAIGAGRLQGEARLHALLMGAGAPAANRIVDLGTSTPMRPAPAIRWVSVARRAPLVDRPVTDHGAAAA
jgi:hypothetical protein